MANVNTAPKLSKKRKLGKNKKKSWRASNVEDIEEYLDDERRQILTGGLVSEKTDDSLFVVDTKSQQQATNTVSEPKAKRSRRDKPLKCLSLLQPDPHSKTVRMPDEDNFQKGKRSRRILQRLRERSQSQVRLGAQRQKKEYEETKRSQREQKKQLPVVDTDLWAGDANNNRFQKVKPPKRYYKKPSALAATSVPHPGSSINPAYDDHQDLLLLAHLTEMKKEKKEKKIYNALDAKFPSKANAPSQSTYLEEMSAGLVDDSEAEESDEDSDDNEASLSVNPPVRREDRKTKKQRRIEKYEGIKTKQKEKEKVIKQHENMVLRIPSIKSEINKEERKQKRKALVKQKLKQQEGSKTRRLGSIKYEEPDVDLKLSTELVASLREMKPEGHLLQDIYKGMQRRNIIEPRDRQKRKRKYKPKKFEKKGHKAVTL